MFGFSPASRTASSSKGKRSLTNKVLSCALAVALALMMVPFVPGNPLGDYDVPAYASPGESKTHPDLNEHVFQNLDPDYVTVPEGSAAVPFGAGATAAPALGTPYSHVYATYSIFDESMSQGYTDLQDIWTKTGGAFIASYPVNLPIYDINPDSDYLVMFMDVDGITDNAKFVYADWNTHDIEHPISLNDQIHYDIDAGIAYIPRNGFTFDEDNAPQNAEDGLAIQAQMVYSVDLSKDNDPLGKIDVSVENNNPNVTAVSPQMTIESPLLDITTSFQLTTTDTSGAISAEDIEVYPNATTEPMRLVYSGEEQNITYNPETGIIGLAVSPMNLVDLRIVIKDNSTATEQAYASGSYGNTTLHDPWDMWQVPGTKLTSIDPDTLQSGQLFWYKGHMNARKADVKGHASTGYCYEVSFGGDYGAIVKWFFDERGTNGLDYSRIGPQMNKGISGLDAEGLRVSTGAYHSLMDHPSGVCYGNAGISQDFTGEWSWDQFATVCGHQSNGAMFPPDYSTQSDHQYWDVWLYIRCIYKAEDYLTLAFQIPIVDGQQAVGIYRIAYEGSGYAKIKKSSANTQLTDGNPNYDLAGAYYDVYTDQSCSGSPVASIGPTDSNGNTAEVKIKKGNYWVKERPGSAPKGYLLDLNPYPVTVDAGAHIEVPVVDKPSGGGEEGFGPSAGFHIVKRDYNRHSDGTNNGAQGSGSLAGATFKVTYYPNQSLSSVAAAKSATPYNGSYSALKPRYITTRPQADGTVKATFNVESAEVGSELPTDSTGSGKKYMLAIGSYLIEEFRAPTGYSSYLDSPSDPLSKTNEKTAVLLRVSQTENGQEAHIKWVDGTNADKTCVTTTTTGNKSADINSGSNDLVFTNIIPRGDISIMKYGEPTTNPDGTPDKKVPLAGVQFEIVNKNANPVMNVQTGQWVGTNGIVHTLATDDQGFATTRRQMTENGWAGIQNNKDSSGGSLAYGDYELREVKGPAQDLGYELMDPIPFSISKNHQHVTMTLENKIGTVVSIQKTDSETGKPVRGSATFRILDSNKEVMTFDDFYPSSAKVSTFTTGIDGIAKLPAKFMPGTYYIQEVSGPEGYLWSDKLVPFTCDTNTVKQYGEYATPMIVEFSDAPAKGQIEVTKTDARTDQPITASAATYGVYAAEDVTTQDGTVRAKQDEKVDTIVTSNSGKGTSKELYLGRYYIVEETAPAGYLISNDKVPVELKYAGDRVAVANEPVTVSDKAVEGEISASKIDKTSGRQIRAAGAVFEVCASENIVGGDGYVWHKKGEVVDTITTDANGVAAATKKLPLGKYEVVEQKAPYGYVTDKTPVPAELKYADQNTPVINVAVEAHDLFSASDFEITKLDRETGKAVFNPNCEIAVYANDEIRTLDGTIHYHKDDWVGTVTTDETGKVVSNLNMPVGKYRLQEISAPAGYVLDDERQYEIEIPWDGGLAGHNIYDAAISDVPAKGVIEFTKVDAETGRSVPVAGIKAEIYASEDIVTGDGTVRYHANDKVADLVTNDTGVARSPELYLGNYRVVETFAPAGYLLNTTPVDVELVYENQNVPVVTAATQIADANAKGVIEVTKIDRETGKTVPLEGAKFEVRAKTDVVTPDGTVRISAGELACEPISTDENGICKTPELYLGIYTITEVQAPYGYTLDTDGYDAVLAYKDQYTPIVTASTSVANIPQKGVVQVTKVDDESKLPIVRPGAVFEIKAMEDIYTPDGTLRVHAGDVADSIETDETGIASSKALYLGKYEVKETKAPTGYLLSDEVKQVELVYGSQTEPLVYEMESVEDHAVKGTVTVHKEDTDLKEPLANVEYEIRAAEDIITGDGTIHHETGDIVETIVTDETGNATSGELYLGKYAVVETVQPNGYELDTKEYPVELTYADQMTPIVHEDMFLYNTPSSVKIKKVSLADPDKAVSGTQFVGWKADDELRYEGKVAIFADPDEYELSAASIAYMGELDAMTVDGTEPEKTFELSKEDNADSEYEVWSSDENVAAGAYVLHVAYVHDGQPVEEGVPFTVNEYDTNAVFAMGGILLQGERSNCFEHVAEPSTPSNGEEGSSPGVPSVDANQADKLADPVEGDVIGEGTDGSAEDTEDYLPTDSDTDPDAPSSGSTAGDTASDIETLHRVPVVLKTGTFTCNVTGEDGMCEFKYVPQGKVGFAEYKPAEGYVSDRTPQYAVFDEGGKIAATDVTGNASGGKELSTEEQVLDLVYADDQTKLHISKQDVTNSQELPGNVLSVYEAKTEGTVDTDGDIASDDYGKLIETWTSTDQVHYMELLPQGSYILKEEQAVAGYTIAEDVKFQVNDTGVVQQVTMRNEHEAGVADELIETMGETGDLFPFAMFMSLVAIASAGAVFYRRRRMV